MLSSRTMKGLLKLKASASSTISPIRLPSGAMTAVIHLKPVIRKRLDISRCIQVRSAFYLQRMTEYYFQKSGDENTRSREKLITRKISMLVVLFAVIPPIQRSWSRLYAARWSLSLKRTKVNWRIISMKLLGLTRFHLSSA